MYFVIVHRFHDAGYYFWKLSVQCLDLVGGGATSGTLKYLKLNNKPIRAKQTHKHTFKIVSFKGKVFGKSLCY